MCLKVVSNVPLKAEKDIVCYKILMDHKNEDETGYLKNNPTMSSYTSPFYNYHISKQVLSGKALMRPKESWPVSKEIRDGYEDGWTLAKGYKYSINEGAIHVMALLEEAKDYADWISIYFDKTCQIFKCVIPAGTQYYFGQDTNGYSGYASCAIKFKGKEKDCLFPKIELNYVSNC